MITDALQYDFIRTALLTGLLVSVSAGVIGTLVVVNRIVFISGGIAHAAYGGIGLGYFFGFSPLMGAMGFSLAAALAMGIVQRKTRQRADTLIGVMWAIGMALGVLMIDLTPGYKADLMSYLFGSILAVPTGDLWLMLGVDLLVLLIVILLYKELLAISFDTAYSTVANVPVHLIYALLLLLTALSVVMMMRVVGLILVIALLTIPAAVAGIFSKNLKSMMGLAMLSSLFVITFGILVSYSLNLNAGATIILVAGLTYGIALMAKSLLQRRAA